MKLKKGKQFGVVSLCDSEEPKSNLEPSCKHQSSNRKSVSALFNSVLQDIEASVALTRRSEFLYV